MENISIWLKDFSASAHHSLFALDCRESQKAGWVANALNQAASVDCPVQFVPSFETLKALDYETRVSQGEVPTRDCAHDWYNGLVWLNYPQTRLALNRAHLAEANKPTGLNGRTRRRDALTLFDENGIVMLTDDVRLVQAFQAFDWHTLFVTLRAEWATRVRLLVVGHGLLEALHAPYKGLCAKVYVVQLPVGFEPVGVESCEASVELGRGVVLGGPTFALGLRDACVAQVVEVLQDPCDLLPMPVMGIPGWFAESEVPGFYDDPAVFRAKPMRRKV